MIYYIYVSSIFTNLRQIWEDLFYDLAVLWQRGIYGFQVWQKSRWGKGGGHDDNELDIVMVLKMCKYMESFLILINRRMYEKLIDTIVNTPMHQWRSWWWKWGWWKWIGACMDNSLVQLFLYTSHYLPPMVMKMKVDDDENE